MSEFKLLDAAGKEDLGGGVSVGITTTLQDAQIAFEGRTDPAETGTVTTSASAPVRRLIDLYDTNASFLTEGIARGSLVINFDDQSIAEVYDVDSETHLRTRIPVNGILNTFTLGDNYQAFNVIQCEISGGNLVAVDGNDGTISPVLPTAFTQVIRTASSSATLINNQAPLTSEETANAVWEKEINGVVEGSFGEAIKSTVFLDHVHLDTNNGVAGTAYPLGTSLHPVNNIADAVTIGLAQGANIIRIAEDATVLSTDTIDGFTLIGGHSTKSEVIIQPGASTDFSKFETLSLLGTLDGWVEIDRCSIEDLVGLQAVVRDSILQPGTFELAGTRVTHFIDCNSGVPGLGTPEVDFGAPGSPPGTSTCAFRGYKGGIKLVNKEGPESVSIDLVSGQVILDGTVTAGTIVVRGVGLLFDNSTGTTIVNHDGLVNPYDTATETWEYTVNGIVSGSFGEAAKNDAFQGHVQVDVNGGSPGTAYPLGTHVHPVDNIADAVIIAAENGIEIIHVHEDVTILSTDNVEGLTILGAHANKSQITMELGAKCNLSQFFNCTFTGSMDGTDSVIVRDSVVADLLLFGGIAHRCAIAGTLQCGSQPVQLLECSSVGSGTQYAVVDFNNSTAGISFRRYSGPLKLINQNNAGAFDIDFATGKLFVETSMSAGTLYLRGIYALTDDSTGTFTIIQETNLDIIQFTIDNMAVVVDTILKYHKNRTLIDENAFTLTVYDDDNVTPIKVFNLKDEAGLASIVSIFERIPQ
jgi:hypothetical protein